MDYSDMMQECIDYIEEHLHENLTVASLSSRFHYSVTHFKRLFRKYRGMALADYVRKRRLAVIAKEIRAGSSPMGSAMYYGYKTYNGFSRAFKEEFHVSPAVYSRGSFENVYLGKYHSCYEEILKLSIVELNEVCVIGKNVCLVQGTGADIPAQVDYWEGKEYLGCRKQRYKGNISVREDYIAFWYKGEKDGEMVYMIGPVVNSFEKEIPKGRVSVILPAGLYAIFETDRETDEENVAETIHMYYKCIFGGWIKEYNDRFDEERSSFERYENGKIYLYVPVHY